MSTTIEVCCNGERIYFRADEFRRGRLRLEDDSVSEQCEGCGADIAQSGRAAGSWIVCDCEAVYPVRRVVRT